MFKRKGTGFNCKDETKESEVAKRKFLNEDIESEMHVMREASGMIHFTNDKDTVRVAVGVVHDAWYQGGGECVRLL